MSNGTEKERKLTPVQQRMLKVLSDGKRHSREELHACLADDLSQMRAIRHHISMIRRVIQPLGEDIICELRSGIWYRQVRHLNAVESSQINP